MENMYLKKPDNARSVVLALAITLALCALPEVAFAQEVDGTGLFCWVAKYFKQIVGAAALVAIFMWAVEHIFGVSKLHEIVMKVGVACGMVIAGAAMITKSSLTTCIGI